MNHENPPNSPPSSQYHDSASGLSVNHTWIWLNHVNQSKERHFKQIFLVTECGHDSCSSHESLKTKAGEQEPPRLKSFHSAEPKLITAPGEAASRLQKSLCQDEDDWWVWVWGGFVRWGKQMDDLRGREKTKLNGDENNEKERNYFLSRIWYFSKGATWRVSLFILIVLIDIPKFSFHYQSSAHSQQLPVDLFVTWVQTVYRGGRRRNVLPAETMKDVAYLILWKPLCVFCVNKK